MPDDRMIVVQLDPGIAVGAIDIFPEQRLDEVSVQSRNDSVWGRDRKLIRLGELDEITISEIIRELNEVTV